MTWLLNNIGTIAVLIILLSDVALIVIRMKKDKSVGKSSCGCGCAHCAMRGKCHDRDKN